MANPHAIAAALTAQKAARQPDGVVASPLVAGYHQWVQGSQAGPPLPRPIHDFLTGGFGPLEPILPMPIDEADQESGRALPRRWQYQVGWNLPTGQPGAEGLKLAGFPALRTFADRYSVVRAMLNIRTNEMAGLTWGVGATIEAQTETKGDKGAVKDQRERARKIIKWFRQIDSNYYGFQSWFTSVLEDQHVCDNVSLHLLPPRVAGKGLFGSDLAEVEQLNGDTIRPLLNIRGATPRPPAPAYQQYLWGVPRSDLQAVMTDRDLEEMDENLRDAGVTGDIGEPEEEYRADQLLYLPRLRRSWTPYGFGSIEQALIPISLGLNRQGFLLDYFTDGTIPGVYVIAGDQYATAAQQRQLQDTLNALAGDVAWKHRVIVLPPGSSTDPQKDLAWQKDVDQTVVEQVAMILHIQMNEISMLPGGRSSGLGGKGQTEGAQQDIARTRTEPDRKWWKETFFDWVIQRVFEQDDLEWKWLDFEDEEDSDKKTTRQVAAVSGGLTTIDAERVNDGLEPFNLPLTQTPFLMSGGAPIPLDPSVPPPAAPAPPGAVGPDGQPIPGAAPGANPFAAKPAAPGAPPAPGAPKPPAPTPGAPGAPGAAKPPAAATKPGTPAAAPAAVPTKTAPFARVTPVPVDAATAAKPVAPVPGPGSPAADETGTPIVHHDGSPATVHSDGGVSEPASGVLFSPDELDQILDVSDDEVEALLNEKQDAPASAKQDAATKAAKPDEQVDPTIAKPEPKYIAGRLNAAYTTGATNDDVHGEVNAIRERSETPSSSVVVATFQRNLARKVRAAIIALAVKKYGRVPSAVAVEATQKAWNVRWLDKFTAAAQRELRAHAHDAHADAPAHEKVLAQMHLDHIARDQEQRQTERRGVTEDRRSGKKYKVLNNRRTGEDRRADERRGTGATSPETTAPIDAPSTDTMSDEELDSLLDEKGADDILAVAADETKSVVAELVKAAGDQPAFLWGRPNPAYTRTATPEHVANELHNIRERGQHNGFSGNEVAVLGTFQRNLERKVRAAIVARAIKTTGKTPSKTVVEATMKKWSARWMAHLMEHARAILDHEVKSGRDAKRAKTAPRKVGSKVGSRTRRGRATSKKPVGERASGKTRYSGRWLWGHAPAKAPARPGAPTRGSKPKPGDTSPLPGWAEPYETGHAKLSVATLVKGRIEYKDSRLTDIVHDYLLRSYPGKVVGWVKDGDWEYDPHVALSDINMARRPGGRNPEKVKAISDSLDQGASMDPIVLVRREPADGYKYDIADGWHRTLGAEEAGWKELPAFIGTGFDDKADWGLEMQDESDSKKVAHAELSVLRRFVRKGGKVENFRTAAVDSDIMHRVEKLIDQGTSLDETLRWAHGRVDKDGGNPQGLRDWYNAGADGQIDWGSPGDFMACVGVASKYMDEDDAKGFCNLRHQDATGGAPGTEKSISVGVGLVPYDLAGAKTATCDVCGAALIPNPDGEGRDCPNGHGMVSFTGKYSEDQPRADDGKWTSGGGGASASTSSDPAHAAVEALARGEQPTIGKKDVAAFMDACLGRSDTPDLTELRVKGTLKFGGDGLGIARVDMPQIPKELRSDFRASLEAQGITCEKEDVKPEDLKPIQKEIDAVHVADMLQTMRVEGADATRIMVTKDDYVLDGHHHWGAAVALSFEAKNVTIPVWRVGLDHQEALDAALAWDKEQGIGGRALGKFDEAQPRDEAGRWSSAGQMSFNLYGVPPIGLGSGGRDDPLIWGTAQPQVGPNIPVDPGVGRAYTSTSGPLRGLDDLNVLVRAKGDWEFRTRRDGLLVGRVEADRRWFHEAAQRQPTGPGGRTGSDYGKYRATTPAGVTTTHYSSGDAVDHLVRTFNNQPAPSRLTEAWHEASRAFAETPLRAVDSVHASLLGQSQRPLGFEIKSASLLAAVDAELVRRGVMPLAEKSASAVGGIDRDGKHYAVGRGEDDDGVFVNTHRARSKSYPTLDDIPTSVLEFIDSTG